MKGIGIGRVHALRKGMEHINALSILSEHFREYRDSFGLYGKDFLYRVYSHIVDSMIQEGKQS